MERQLFRIRRNPVVPFPSISPERMETEIGLPPDIFYQILRLCKNDAKRHFPSEKLKFTITKRSVEIWGNFFSNNFGRFYVTLYWLRRAEIFQTIGKLFGVSAAEISNTIRIVIPIIVG